MNAKTSPTPAQETAMDDLRNLLGSECERLGLGLEVEPCEVWDFDATATLIHGESRYLIECDERVALEKLRLIHEDEPRLLDNLLEAVCGGYSVNNVRRYLHGWDARMRGDAVDAYGAPCIWSENGWDEADELVADLRKCG